MPFWSLFSFLFKQDLDFQVDPPFKCITDGFSGERINMHKKRLFYSLEMAGFEYTAVTSSEKLYLHCSRINQQVLLLDAFVEQVLQEPVSNTYLSWHLSRPEDTHRSVSLLYSSPPSQPVSIPTTTTTAIIVIK